MSSTALRRTQVVLPVVQDQEVGSVQIVSQCYLNEAYDNSPSTHVSISHDMDRIQRDGELVVLSKDKNPSGHTVEENQADPRHLNVRSYFLYGIPAEVLVTELYQSADLDGRDVSYKMELKHDGYFWTILRSFEEIRRVYLGLYHYNLSVPQPRAQIPGKSDSGLELDGTSFPLLPEVLPPNSDMQTRVEHCRSVEKFVSHLLANPLWREYEASRRFFSVSAMSFRDGRVSMRQKDLEVMVEKLSCRISDVHHNFCSHDNVVCQAFARWKLRWVVVQETCYMYIRPESGEIAAVFLFNQRMEIKQLKTRPQALMLKHSFKDLVLEFASALEKEYWLGQMADKMSSTGADWVKAHPHSSFAPLRDDIYAKFYINGANFMPAVADAIESAKEEIFIGGWWVAPEVFLKRPVTEGTRWRLDKLLKRKAEEGVKIYILMYKESRVVLGINSLYSKKKLKKIHPNIMVLRHPDHNVLLWSHHEKSVIIDQKMAFLGGIDLCYGRWEDHHYRINDQSPEMRQSPATGSLKEASKSLAGRKFKKPKAKAGGAHRRGKRYAFGQAAMAPVRGIQARFNVPRFRFGTRTNHRYRRYKRSFLGKTALAFRVCGKKRKDSTAEENETSDDNLHELGRKFTWIGKDYINEVKESVSQSSEGNPYEDELDRDKVPRLPWHDAGTCIWGAAARDAARHFIQKWNACKLQKFRFEPEYPCLIPKRYQDLKSLDCAPEKDAHRCRVQVLRSTASWSSGLLPHVSEHSIQQAYIDLILKAKHFVYMESQFFITGTDKHKKIKNRVGNAIFDRIVRAAKDGETFRFYIVIPLQSAIAGVYGTRGGAALQAVTHFIYRSISRGGFSLFEQLRAKGIDPSRYITISGLRQHGEISGQLATEVVYVHSKVMVVDDIYTIIGSANMNDRSMVGDRDSEIAIVLEDCEFEDSVMDGRPYRSGKYSGRLRKELMKINLGLVEDLPRGVPFDQGNSIVCDPVCQQFFHDRWIKTAVRNDEIYAQVFAPVPNDKVLRFSELKEWEKQETLNETNPEEARVLLRTVQGYIVKFPLKFLRDSRLLPTISTAAGLLPIINWT